MREFPLEFVESFDCHPIRLTRSDRVPVHQPVWREYGGGNWSNPQVVKSYEPSVELDVVFVLCIKGGVEGNSPTSGIAETPDARREGGRRIIGLLDGKSVHHQPSSLRVFRDGLGMGVRRMFQLQKRASFNKSGHRIQRVGSGVADDIENSGCNDKRSANGSRMSDGCYQTRKIVWTITIKIQTIERNGEEEGDGRRDMTRSNWTYSNENAKSTATDRNRLL